MCHHLYLKGRWKQQYLITCFDLPEVKEVVEARVLDEAIVEFDTFRIKIS